MSQLSPKDCVVLVPCGEAIAALCEDSLRVLESRGYEVRRVRGFSQIDLARNSIATTAIRDGTGEAERSHQHYLLLKLCSIAYSTALIASFAASSST